MQVRKISVFTGNRAEYGLQFPILKAIDAHPNLDYKLIVSGAHLDKNFGRTLAEIESDGFNVETEVKIKMDSKSAYGSAKAIGSGIIEISKALSKIKPDINVVYADRFEGLSAVIASSQMNIPTAHIEGGDLTEGGALDDSVRHAMTKLSHLHFTTNQQASNRILGMGEEEWRVHTVGFPAIDMISEGNYASLGELTDIYGLDVSRPIVLFTQHSVTTEFENAGSQILPSLRALERLAKNGVQIFVTYPNNDAGSNQIVDMISRFEMKKINNFYVYRSLGRYNYHGLLSLARMEEINIVCVGNSSSGIKETPAFGCPTVNIGSRQQSRLRANNIIDVDYDENQIFNAIKVCLYDHEFKKQCAEVKNPYWLGNAGRKIASVLHSIPLDQKLLRKKMTLIGEINNGWFK